MTGAAQVGRVSRMRAVHIPHLMKLRDEAFARSGKSDKLSPVEHEWARLSREHRLVFMLLAGIDEAESVVMKDWREFTPPEVCALKLVMRDMSRAVAGLSALVRL